MSPFWSLVLALKCFVCLSSAFQVPVGIFLIPITRPGSQKCFSNAVHGSIIQQQHINRGVRRLATMTGRTPPTPDMLLFALFQRISHLPDVLLKKYELEEVKKNMALHLFNHRRIPRAETDETLGHMHGVGLSIETYDLGYMATVKMGNPPQNFQLLVDSGSADLWVGGEGCHSTNGADCGAHKFLGSNSSKTFRATQRKWLIGYVSGTVSGFLAEDDISISDLTLKNLTFGVALNETRDFTSDNIPFDGILGLAKPDISQQGVPTLLRALYQRKLISAPIVAYRIPRSADNKNDGEMTIGGLNPRLFDPASVIKRRNVNKFGFWEVAVDAVVVGTKDMQWSNRSIVLDTGTSLIIAPKGDVEAIHRLIPSAKNNGAGWEVPCNMTTYIALTIGRQSFAIDPRDIAFYPLADEPGFCMSGIAVGGVGPFYLDNEWLVGDVFLKNVYFSTDENTDEVLMAKPLS